jgi:putative two-component system response regulator
MPHNGGAGNSVLVVDDVDLNIMILEEILRDEYQVVTAANGREALGYLRNAAMLPKIILLDLLMPEMTGRELFEILKADEALRRIPVMFITAENDSEDELLAAGAVDFINKPFMPQRVKLRVRNQVALKNYSDNLEQMVAEKTAEATATLDNALQGLANVIEHRDLESGEHVKRTQLYVQALCARVIAAHAPCEEELRRLDPATIVKAMALHDVGKIAIPDRILLKAGRLDDEEFAIMKTHTIRGKEIIGELGDVNSSLYLRHCEDICYSHHERYDGKGYPQGLRGDEIPLAARIASLADVYDALVSARVYKAAFSYGEAAAIIREGRGTQFDPTLTDLAMQIQDEFREIARQH